MADNKVKEAMDGVVKMYGDSYNSLFSSSKKEEPAPLTTSSDFTDEDKVMMDKIAKDYYAKKKSSPQTKKPKVDKPPKGLDNDRTNSLDGLDAKSVSKQATGGRVGSGLGCGAATKGFGAVRKK